ncbi:MAG: hypothetical protein AB4057_18655 [Crocosphaera sp.]
MTGIKSLKIFLASSSELKEDREQFEIFINRKNKQYIKQGIFLELVIWEDFLDAISQTRLQDEYNKVITECDLFVSLFLTKVGQYTEEEFDTAFGTFKENNKPLIYTYFKDSPINLSRITTEINTLLKFKEKLSNLGHFYTSYNSIEDLKYRFDQQLNKAFEQLIKNLAEKLTVNSSRQQEIESLKQELEITKKQFRQAQSQINQLHKQLETAEQSEKSDKTQIQELEKRYNNQIKELQDSYNKQLAQAELEKQQYKNKIKNITEDDIFTEDFYFLEGEGNLPGSLVPEDIDEITYTIDKQEHQLTPLLPLKPEILNYFSPEELIKNITFEPTFIGMKSGVRVTLKLGAFQFFTKSSLRGSETLSISLLSLMILEKWGEDVAGKACFSALDFFIEREYPIEQSNAITAKPFLEIWPNFKAPNWKAYYAFYFDDRIEASQEYTTFRVVFPETIEMEKHPTDSRNYEWTRLESFPDYIICQDENDPTLIKGLILLKTPPDVGTQSPNKTWTVGVDFSDSFTNVYYKIDNCINPLTLTPLHLQITQTALSSRLGLLYNYFMSAEEETFPLSSVLTIKGGQGQERPILDGRVYILEDYRAFDPTQDDIKMNLKWEPDNISYNRTFLKHLALLITTEAAKNHVRKIEWSIAYPPSFSRSDQHIYKVTWQDILNYLNTMTGIDHQWLKKGNAVRSRNMAVAQYFADQENKDLVYTTCIFLDNETSDITVWVGNRLIHQCSLKLTHRHLFSQFWKDRPTFLNQQFNADLTDLTSGLQDEPFFFKLDGLLAAEGNSWLEKNRILMGDDPNLLAIVQLSSLAISGLYYYIGMVLRALNLEEKYTRKQNTRVYVGGYKNYIFNWLDLRGEFTSGCDVCLLFSRMLSKGSGFQDNGEITILSSQPGSEVACGLVLDQKTRQLKGLQEEDEDIFAGEDCVINGVPFGWKDRLDMSQFRQIEQIKLYFNDEDVEMSKLKSFFDDFLQAFQDLGIISIKPFREYQDEMFRKSLWRNVKRRVQVTLTYLEGRNSEEIEVEPPFILGLKALLQELNETVKND